MISFKDMKRKCVSDGGCSIAAYLDADTDRMVDKCDLSGFECKPKHVGENGILSGCPHPSVLMDTAVERCDMERQYEEEMGTD